MRSFVTFALSVSITLSSFQVGHAQAKRSAEDQAKLEQAHQIALQFVERFRRTRDFGTVWRQFHTSDVRCEIHSSPILPEYSNLEEKELDQWLKEMKLDDRVLERYYITVWNVALLFQAYIYSITPSKGGSAPDPEAMLYRKRKTTGIKELLKAARNSKYWMVGLGEGKRLPRTAKEFKEYIVEANRLAALLRTYMPRNAMRSAYWRSAVMWFEDRYDMTQILSRGKDDDPCILRAGPTYVAQIGPFCFGFVEENGKMKLLTMMLISD